jgi:hypothetical protein
MGSGWNFNGSAAHELGLKPLCQQVDKHFSDCKLYRYFAATDDPLLALDLGQYYRGFQAAASTEWPYYLEEKRRSFDYLVYIRQSTCIDPTGCTLTYAHELQHIVQHRLYPKLLEINRVLRRDLPDFMPTATEVDLPTEVDANITSKRIAEIVCGADAVRRYAGGQLRLMDATGAANQKAKWEFLLNTPSSTTYEPLVPTLEAVKKYKGRINFGMDVERSEWWLGPT